MQLFEPMGDARHKKPPPIEEEEDVTPEFLKLVKAKLDANREDNKKNGLGRRDPKRLIDDRASLARAVDTDTTNINNILGPVRSSSKPKKPSGRSVFVRPIRRVLGLEATTSVEIPEADIARVRKLLSLDPAGAFVIDAALDKLTRKPGG